MGRRLLSRAQRGTSEPSSVAKTTSGSSGKLDPDCPHRAAHTEPAKTPVHDAGKTEAAHVAPDVFGALEAFVKGALSPESVRELFPSTLDQKSERVNDTVNEDTGRSRAHACAQPDETPNQPPAVPRAEITGAAPDEAADGNDSVVEQEQKVVTDGDHITHAYGSGDATMHEPGEDLVMLLPLIPGTIVLLQPKLLKGSVHQGGLGSGADGVITSPTDQQYERLVIDAQDSVLGVLRIHSSGIQDHLLDRYREGLGMPKVSKDLTPAQKALGLCSCCFCSSFFLPCWFPLCCSLVFFSLCACLGSVYRFLWRRGAQEFTPPDKFAQHDENVTFVETVIS